MHYKKLIEAHKLFYGGFEHRAPFYDNYMENKNWEEWLSPSISITEIKKLFRFIRSWDRFFQGDEDKFKKIYEEIYPIIRELEHEKIEDLDLTDDRLKRKIRDVFDKVAKCPLIDRYESTDASKILHTILPNLFVMWDVEIKEWMVQGRRMGATYAFYFLPKVQEELKKAIKTCMDERNLSREEAIEYIHAQCDGKTLAKLADQYNYMKYTKLYPSLWSPGEAKRLLFR